MKLLTITVPMYNVANYIEECLKSFLVPGAEEALEVLVVNDETPDKSREIAEKFVEKYPEIYRIIDKKNGGHGSTVNRGIEEASGKYFKVVDGDDWVDQKAFENFLAHLQKTDADMVLSNYHWVDDKTKNRKEEVSEICPGIEYGKDIPFSEVKDRIFAKMHAITYKTSVLRNQPERLDEKCFYVDAEYVIFPLPYIQTVSAIPDFVYQYRIGMSTQSMSIENMMKRCSQHERVLKRIMDFYDKHKTCAAAEMIRDMAARLAVSQYKIYLSFPRSHKTRMMEMEKEIREKFPEVYSQMKNPAVQVLRSTGYLTYGLVSMAVRYARK